MYISLPHISYSLTKINREITWEERIAHMVNLINDSITENEELTIDTRYEPELGVNMVRSVLMRINHSKDKIKILTSVDPKEKLRGYNYEIDYKASCNWFGFYEKIQQQNINWKDIRITHHFLSMAGRPSEPRALLTKYLLDLYSDNCMISFGSKHIELEKSLKDIISPYPYPIVLDKPNKPTFEDIHSPPGDIVYGALCQIVQETNERLDQEIYLSEKSFKVFAWHQLPIYVTVPGHVQKVRDIGFDVFDDIFEGHKYDLETSRNIHRLKILSLIKRLLDRYPTIEDAQELRYKLWDRIVANNNHLASMVIENTAELQALQAS